MTSIVFVYINYFVVVNSAYPSLFSRDDWVRSKDDEIPMSTVPAPGSGRQSVRKSLRKAHENNT